MIGGGMEGIQHESEGLDYTVAKALQHTSAAWRQRQQTFWGIPVTATGSGQTSPVDGSREKEERSEDLKPEG